VNLGAALVVYINGVGVFINNAAKTYGFVKDISSRRYSDTARFFFFNLPSLFSDLW
jgi:hypothetical protein